MENDPVISNIKSLIGIIGEFERSRFLGGVPGLVACDGGTGEAYENYALLTPGASCDVEELIETGVGFFKKTGSPHIWPLFPGLPGSVRSSLERRGARADGEFFGMIADTGAMKGVAANDDDSFEGLWPVCERDIRDWADAVWFGFDSGTGAPESFALFAREAGARGEISLFSLRRKLAGETAATGLLCASGEAAGIYYVATRPEFRRRGLGLLVMRALLDRAAELGFKRACLLATPSGKPLYVKCGFTETSRVLIMIHG
ncbi:MAG: GNAT family N-acetyltransferase [Synergistaceae bacterium]|nr:GNAT family N-acetyltransferase [Synergistaceae bacterium]